MGTSIKLIRVSQTDGDTLLCRYMRLIQSMIESIEAYGDTYLEKRDLVFADNEWEVHRDEQIL